MRGNEPQRGVVGSGKSYRGHPGRPVAKRRGQRRARREGKSGGTANSPKLEARLRGATIVKVETSVARRKTAVREARPEVGRAWSEEGYGEPSIQ